MWVHLSGTPPFILRQPQTESSWDSCQASVAAQLPSYQEVALSCLGPPNYPIPDLLRSAKIWPHSDLFTNLVHKAWFVAWVGPKAARASPGKALA